MRLNFAGLKKVVIDSLACSAVVWTEEAFFSFGSYMQIAVSLICSDHMPWRCLGNYTD